MTVREAVLRVILRALEDGDPLIFISVIHAAHYLHPFSGAQRLRELRKEGIISYKFSTKATIEQNGKPLKIDYKHYDFTGTKIRDVKKALKGGR